MPQHISTEYPSQVHKPDDFDAFWDGVQRQAEAIPLHPDIIPDPLRSSAEIEVFQVFSTSLDHVRIAAWYCRPAHRPAQAPAILFLPGYQRDPPIPKEWARKGYIALSVAPRGKLRSHPLPSERTVKAVIGQELARHCHHVASLATLPRVDTGTSPHSDSVREDMQQEVLQTVNAEGFDLHAIRCSPPPQTWANV